MNNELKQFVLLEHSASDGMHWDLMLEDAGALLTWRFSTPPQDLGIKPLSAERIFDHELRFLTYEGPVQKNTGTVRRIDHGLCRWIGRSDTVFTAHLNGSILKGIYQLTRQGQGPDWIIAHP